MADGLNVRDASNTIVQVVTKDTGSGVQLYKHALADATTPAQTAAVSAGGALKVDNSGVTQPVSAASLPLPSGASTAAKQPALGTAGSAATDVLTVQGIASGTPQPVSGTFWQTTQPVSGTVTANAGTGTLATSVADGSDASLGAKADSAATTDTGTFSLIALFKRLLATYFAAGLKILSQQGAASISNSQVSVTTSAGTLLASRATRRSLTIKNTDATNPIYIGAATVTTANGMPVKAGESIVITWVGLVQAISTGGTVTAACLEEYD